MMSAQSQVAIHSAAANLDAGVGSRARLGVIVLATDQTLEPELSSIALPGVAWHYARIPMDSQVTPTTLAAMHAHLPSTSSLLPSEFAFKSIGFACTSASTVIGDDAVAAAINTHHRDAKCTNPILAAVTALKSMGVVRVGLLTPYTDDVTSHMIDHLQRQGVSVATAASFQEPSDLKVPLIDSASIVDAALQVGENAACDAVFISCTSLRSFSLIAELEQRLGKPVISSNQAFAWHMLRLAGINDQFDSLGRLFSAAH